MGIIKLILVSVFYGIGINKCAAITCLGLPRRCNKSGFSVCSLCYCKNNKNTILIIKQCK